MNITLGQLVALFGGASAAVIAVSTWISHLVTERIISKWRRDEQSTVEILKSALAGDKLLFESAIRGFQTGQDAHQPKRLTAIERLWAEILCIREQFSQPIFFCSVFVPEEYEMLLKERKDIIAPILEINIESISARSQQGNELERERPYLGETLWLQFFIYRAFLCRLAHNLSEGARKGNLQDWRKDHGIRQILLNVLTTEMVASLLDKEIFIVAINRTVNILESLMLKEISLIVSGRQSSFESFENAKELQDRIAACGGASSFSSIPRFM